MGRKRVVGRQREGGPKKDRRSGRVTAEILSPQNLCQAGFAPTPCQTGGTALSPSHPARIDTAMRSSVIVLGLSLLRAADLAAQTEAETQRATLIGLRSFGVHASVQLSRDATLERIDEQVLRARIEDALRGEGI